MGRRICLTRQSRPHCWMASWCCVTCQYRSVGGITRQQWKFSQLLPRFRADPAWVWPLMPAWGEEGGERQVVYTLAPCSSTYPVLSTSEWWLNKKILSSRLVFCFHSFWTMSETFLLAQGWVILRLEFESLDVSRFDLEARWAEWSGAVGSVKLIHRKFRKTSRRLAPCVYTCLNKTKLTWSRR